MSFREQRRFPRVNVMKSLSGLVRELSAQVTWPNLETSTVADLSYKGMAVRRPGILQVDVQQKHRVLVELGGQKPFAVDARIAWCNLDWVGLEFSSLPPAGHQAMRAYVDAKLVGASLQPVERVFVAHAETFHYWYQGQGRAHVYIWMTEDHKVERVVVDLDGEVSDFVRGPKKLRMDEQKQRAFLLLSQMDKEGLPMEEFVRHLLLGA